MEIIIIKSVEETGKSPERLERFLGSGQFIGEVPKTIQKKKRKNIPSMDQSSSPCKRRRRVLKKVVGLVSAR